MQSLFSPSARPAAVALRPGEAGDQARRERARDAPGAPEGALPPRSGIHPARRVRAGAACGRGPVAPRVHAS
eukprot:6188082-Pleurochrysis_carterae.AAC.2